MVWGERGPLPSQPEMGRIGTCRHVQRCAVEQGRMDRVVRGSRVEQQGEVWF